LAGIFQAWRDVRVESVMRKEADIDRADEGMPQIA